MNILTIKNLSFSYNSKCVLDNISLYVRSGEIVALLGGSGAGKTTLFNLIAGILPSSGEIIVQGKELLKIGYMQQNDLLLEHLDVLHNVALPLIINGYKKELARQKALSLLKDFELAEFALKYPKNLSGGQRQRIAFLRTIILRASLYLLDEPFNALDFITKSKIHAWFLDIQKELNLPVLLITHDIDEAIALSNRIYILHYGKIIQELSINDSLKDYKKEILQAIS